jgi:hypothetical protein
MEVSAQRYHTAAILLPPKILPVSLEEESGRFPESIWGLWDSERSFFRLSKIQRPGHYTD